MNNLNFQKQLQFLIEVDKMKNVLRQTLLVDKSRQETDAEHSWHFALMAITLFEYAYSPSIDILRVLKMALIHDLVEVYAGDTFAFDEISKTDIHDKENAAAIKLFSLLPSEQCSEYRLLWEEFEAMKTPDSIYAAAIDRLQPFLNDSVTQGHTWKLHSVTSDKVYKRMEIVKKGIPELWSFVENVIEDSIEKGYIIK